MIKSAPVCLCKKKIRILPAARGVSGGQGPQRRRRLNRKRKRRNPAMPERSARMEWKKSARFLGRILKLRLLDRLFGFGDVRELAGEILERIGYEVGAIAVVAFGHSIYLLNERLRQTYGYLSHADCLSRAFFTCHILFSLFYCWSVSSNFAGYAQKLIGNPNISNDGNPKSFVKIVREKFTVK